MTTQPADPMNRLTLFSLGLGLLAFLISPLIIFLLVTLDALGGILERYGNWYWEQGFWWMLALVLVIGLASLITGSIALSKKMAGTIFAFLGILLGFLGIVSLVLLFTFDWV